MTSDRTPNAEVHTLTGAYVTDALSESERTLFERHLADCRACAEEVAELQETTALVAVSEAVPPPDRLRARVMAEIAATRQIPPSVPGPEQAAPGRRAAPRRLLTVAAAVLAVALAGTGVLTAYLYQQLQHTRGTADHVTSVLTAPDVQTATAAASGDEAGGTVVFSRDRDRAVFLPATLPGIPEDRTYQVWLIGDGDPRSAGLLPDPRSTEPLVISASLDRIEGLGVTVEPAGGSPQPTTRPVLELALPPK